MAVSLDARRKHPAVSPPTTDMPPAPSADQVRWFTEEVYPHNAQLESYLRSAFPAVRDMEDIVQESLLRIWQARARQSIRSAKDFLFQIGRHVATDTLRRQCGSPVDFVAELPAAAVLEDAPSAAEVVCAREEFALLADAMALLPPRCREILILRKIKRLPQREIARRLGISVFTVQNQVSRGVKRCEEYLAKHGVRHARRPN